MSLLLDTHVLLWALQDSPRLGPQSRERMLSSPCHVSAASVWEISIKVDRGKLQVPDDLWLRVEAAGIRSLPITPRHAHRVGTILGLPHRDPFDRMLLAQAVHEGLALVTADQAILAADLDPEVPRYDARE